LGRGEMGPLEITEIGYNYRMNELQAVLCLYQLGNLEKLLEKRRSAILGRWTQLILETYPINTQRFLKKQKDQFSNPVGYTISKEVKNLYEELLQGIDSARVSPIIERIIRVRAIQDFSPSKAVAFIFLLKRVIREELEKEIQENQVFDEFLMLESSLDDLALLAFDIYMECREKIYEIRANEAKNQVSGLLRRAGLTYEIPEWEQNS